MRENWIIRESSFNMTRGEVDEDIERGAPKIFKHPKGGLRKFVYFKTNRKGGPPKKIEPLVRGAAKISSLEFQYLHLPPPPLVILDELSLIVPFI